MQFGVSSWVWTASITTEGVRELAPKVKKMGFDLLELPIETVGDLNYAETRQILDDCGLAVGMCCAIGPDRDLIHEDESIQQNARAYYNDCISAARQLGATRIVGPMYSSVGRVWEQTPDSRARDMDTLVGHYKDICAQAENVGVVLAVEPLNRFETSFFNTAEQMMEFIERVDSPSCGVLLDSFHMNIEEKSFGDAIRLVGSHLASFHACGNDRGAPGKGTINWTEIAEALKAINYDRQLVIESFTSEVKSIARAASIWRSFEPSQDALAQDGLDFLKTLF